MKAPRRALVPLALLVLAACSSNPPRTHGTHDNIQLPQSQRYSQRNDSSPDISGIDFSKIPEPVPKVEPKSRYGNKSPYSVNGHTYHVLPTAAGYVKRGMASYYATKFNGYKTADLETYDMYKFTAASPVLPLPSFARVTNLANGKSVIVRVNDRGPFVPDRIIDLSVAAAVRLGIWRKGTGRVEVQGIDPAHPRVEPRPVAAVPRRSGKQAGLYLQVGAFANSGNARRLAARLETMHIGPVRVDTARVRGRRLRQVRIGPLPDARAVAQTSARLDAAGLPHATVAGQ